MEGVLIVLIMGVVILASVGVLALEEWTRHRERMEMIRHGIDPDYAPADVVEEDP